ncbi:MAG: cystathionine gamma-synthase [Bacteroidetes bacterium]|nr:MAG: cystathionine gamma-synthase [Bacteroidota bacterium]MBL1143845.1 cystathionine gamma-synthase [Bacteroidota bacterium]MCB0802451.1 cystathionine gamma-synthase [Flavobacteriales bacterium]NOG56646.1 cystathionine gamma-synthase [Bacteroidota bacterium]
MRFGTKVIHAGLEPDSATGAVMTPIYQTSTYHQKTPGEHKGFAYSRTSNPTRKALENNLAALENGKFGMCFGSGLAAIDAAIKLLKSGDEVISTDDLYGGTYRIFTQIFEPFGIKFKFVPMNDMAQIEAAITSNTKMIWVETPTNPMMNIIDIAAVSAIAKKHRVLLAVDNTFATPYLQTPLDLGADIVMHSLTKYLGGHSDVVMGALVCKDAVLAERLYFIQNSSGAVCGPQDSFLVLRGIKTLHLRMQRHCENGKVIANYLKSHPKVAGVFWPGFEDHPNHEIAKKQMCDFGGMISFTLKGDLQEEAYKVMSSFRVFTLAESLGGVESLICHPASMTHAAIPKEQRQKSGVLDSMIRLSVGVEDISDLLEDIEFALNQI